MNANTDKAKDNATAIPTATPYSLGDKETLDLMTGIEAALRAGAPEKPGSDMLSAIQRFSADLLLASAGNTGNIMISPASVYLALGMTLNGADGETREAMLEVLAERGILPETINRTCRDWTALLKNTGEKTTLDVTNSLWFDRYFSPYQPFLQANADYYAAAARKLDFRSPSAPGIINDWIREATRGTIEKVIDSIDPSVVMYLINTIYFKSEWLMPFETKNTHPQIFHTPEGGVEVPFMHRTEFMSYLALTDAKGIALPYDNRQFAFFALLPDGNITPREWLSRQEPSELFRSISGCMTQASHAAVELALPKFEMEYEDSLKDELTRLGMGVAFDPAQADFSRMNESRAKNLFISEIKHKTFIRVDEKGTEAGAVTSVEMTLTGAPMPALPLVFDQPFLYGIMDMTTGLPLFVGIMKNPS